MTLKEQEEHFNRLTEITDRVALVNSVYEADVSSALGELEAFTSDVMTWDLESMDGENLRSFLSHMSFHREIVADIIEEARRLLMEERRELRKRLVAYHKELSTWLAKVQKRRSVV